ncbi:hypothetical protein [Ferrovibrio sp.]|uniref:hypothetical protein n=1 Tax=Ferrovibrio sp. TaxID=1917215 RepID=UPI0035AFB9EF
MKGLDKAIQRLMHGEHVDLEHAIGCHDWGGGSDSPSGTQVIQQNNDPWSGAQPYIEDYLGWAKDLSGQATPELPFSTVVPFSNQTESALGSMEQLAKARLNRGASSTGTGTWGGGLAGSGALGAGFPDPSQAGLTLGSMPSGGQYSGADVQFGLQDQIGQTLNGDFLSAENPYFSQMTDRVSEAVLPKINAQFSAAGRGDSPLAARAAAMGVTDALGNLAYQNYNNERTNQLRATTVAPTVSNLDFANAAQLANVGAQREDLAGRQLSEEISRFYQPIADEQSRLANYAALVQGGNVGGTSTSTQPLYSNSTGNFLGTALGLAGLGQTLFGSGSGTGLLRGLW